VRLCGSARFSGTGKSAHHAAVLSPLFGWVNSHAVSVSEPSCQVAGLAEGCGCAAATGAALEVAIGSFA
jgi:hypothetical protein